jgi:hypothetical protein
MEVSGQIHALIPSTLEKNLRYPFYRRVGGIQSRSTPAGNGASVVVQTVVPSLAIQAPLHLWEYM